MKKNNDTTLPHLNKRAPGNDYIGKNSVKPSNHSIIIHIELLYVQFWNVIAVYMYMAL